MDAVLERALLSFGVSYVVHTHPPVFTCEEAATHCAHIPGIASKNLFLKDDAGRFFLVILPDGKRLDMKGFRARIGAKALRFCSDDELREVLGLTPGSVSPFGLLNDTGRRAIVHIDAEVWSSPIVTFHPNINTETLEMTQEMFRRFLTAVGVTPTVSAF